MYLKVESVRPLELHFRVQRERGEIGTMPHPELLSYSMLRITNDIFLKYIFTFTYFFFLSYETFLK